MNSRTAIAQSHRPWRKVQRTYAATRGPGAARLALFASAMSVPHFRRRGRKVPCFGARASPSSDLSDPERRRERVAAAEEDVDDPMVVEDHSRAAHSNV